MANYQWYKPILGSVDYIWQIPAHIDETEDIANEVETARGLQATLSDNLDTKANLSGDTFTGAVIISTGNLTLSSGNVLIGADIVVVKDAALSDTIIVSADSSGRVTTSSGIVATNIATLSGTQTITGVKTFTAIPAFNGGTSGSSSPFTVNSTEMVTSLNAQYLGNWQSSSYARLSIPNTFTNVLTCSAGLTLGGALSHTPTSSRDKIRLWSVAPYSMGMGSPYTYGYLSGLAMTFQMNNTANTGWWWGHSVHTDAQGAMSLTNDGRLYVDSIVDSNTFISRVTTGTAPLTVSSTTVVTNLNADLLDGAEGALYARLASPLLTGNPTAPTQTAGDNDTSIATTAYVKLDTKFGSYTAYSINTNYLAASDLVVYASIIALGTNSTYRVRGYTDASATPTTERANCSVREGQTSTMVLFVRNGDYWRVTQTGGGTVSNLHYLPIGS